MTALYWRDMNKKADMYYTKNILIRYGFAPWVRLLAQSRSVSACIAYYLLNTVYSIYNVSVYNVFYILLP